MNTHKASPAWRRWLLGATLAVIVAGGIWQQFLRGPIATDPELASPSAEATTQVIPSASASSAPETCSFGSTSFTPKTLEVAGVGNNRIEAHAPSQDGTAPVPQNLSGAVYAWDKASAKARGNGSVIMTAHTFPTTMTPALGNKLIRQLKLGAVIKVAGGGGVQCYKVAERRLVPLANKSAVASALAKIYDDASDKLVIYVCDGIRRGPGDWSARTVWYATPMK